MTAPVIAAPPTCDSTVECYVCRRERTVTLPWPTSSLDLLAALGWTLHRCADYACLAWVCGAECLSRLECDGTDEESICPGGVDCCGDEPCGAPVGLPALRS